MKFAEQNGFKVRSSEDLICLTSKNASKFVYSASFSMQVFFVESVCEDPEVIAQNIVVSTIPFKSVFIKSYPVS